MTTLRRRRALRMVVPAAALAVAAVAGTIIALSSGSAPPLTTEVCRADPVLAHSAPVSRLAAEGTARPAPLHLGLTSDGVVHSVRVGDRTLPALPGGGGFSVRMAGQGPNLLPNPSFEQDTDGKGIPDNWGYLQAAGGSVPRLDTTVAHSGASSLRVSNPTRGTSGSFWIEVPVEPRTSYVFSAWFRSRDVRPTFPTAIRETYQPHSPFKVDVQQLVNGEVVDTSSAWGYTGTAGWNRQFTGLRTGDDVTSVRIVGRIERGSGTGWFDDLYLGRLFPDGPAPIRGTLSKDGDRVVERASLPRHGISLSASFTTAPDHVLVDGMVEGNGTTDQAFQLTYTVPIDATGWTWWDYARRSRPIGDGTYSYLSTSSLQQASRYPWGVVADTQSALAIGVPLDQPRMFRIAYDAQAGLSITFDLGVSPAALALQDRATFSFVIYSADPVWGFRSATQRYYDLFPELFARRTDPACEGAWFVAPPLDSIERTYLDFGLGLNMLALGKASSQSHATWGLRYLRWDNARHIATTAYTHQWAFYDRVGRGGELSYEQAIGHLQAEAGRRSANPDQERIRDEAAAALKSTALDFNGRLYYERFGDFYAYYENLDTSSPSLTSWAGAVQAEQVQRATNLAASVGRLDGIHLDSTSGMRRWGAADDYDRRHWAIARLPLTFSYFSGQVVVRGIFPMYDRIADMARFVRDRGMMLTANFNAAETQTLGFVGAGQIDYFGLEQGLADRVRQGASADRFAMLKRTLAYQRPVSTLDHRIGQERLDAEEIEHRLQQNLFYGVFAGAFDAETEADATGTRATWSTHRNAELWARYAPLIKEVAMAGWQPVTDAWTSTPQVWVERFGSLAGRNLHFTLRNETAVAQRFVLTVDIRSLRASPTKALRTVEEITGASLRIQANHAGGVAVLSTSIPPESTRLLAVSESA